MFSPTVLQPLQKLNQVLTHLSGEEHGSVIVLRVPLARWVEELLPGAEVPQSHAPVAGNLRANPLVLHHQHLHQHNVYRVLYAGVLVKLGGHRDQGQNVVLRRTDWTFKNLS